MKKIADELRKLSNEEINKRILELKDELFDLRMQKSTAALEKPHRIKAAKKEIARLLTILTERENEGGNE